MLRLAASRVALVATTSMRRATTGSGTGTATKLHENMFGKMTEEEELMNARHEAYAAIDHLNGYDSETKKKLKENLFEYEESIKGLRKMFGVTSALHEALTPAVEMIKQSDEYKRFNRVVNNDHSIVSFAHTQGDLEQKLDVVLEFKFVANICVYDPETGEKISVFAESKKDL